MININMRCIEMMKATLKALKEFKININMRCIEIRQKLLLLLSVAD